MKERDDMELFTYVYRGLKFEYRIPDSCMNIEREKCRYIVNVRKMDGNDYFLVPFTLNVDDMYMACSVVESKIREHVDAKSRI